MIDEWYIGCGYGPGTKRDIRKKAATIMMIGFGTRGIMEEKIDVIFIICLPIYLSPTHDFSRK